MFHRTRRPVTARAILVVSVALAGSSVAPALASPARPVSCEIPSTPESTVRSAEQLGEMPTRFEPNVGQFDPEVEFVARGGGYTLFLTPSESVLSLRKLAEEAKELTGGAEVRRTASESAVVRTQLVGSRTSAAGEGVGVLPGTTNYFIGNDPSRWRTGIVSFGAVRYTEVYSGIDLVYHVQGTALEYDFVLQPGAEASAIRMRMTGAERIRIDEAGDLVLDFEGGGELRHRAPVSYQEGPNGRERVTCGYTVCGDEVMFAAGAYDPSRPLVIDPVLAYSRDLFSGAAAQAVAAGADGSAYVTGYAFSSSFPRVLPTQGTLAGGLDAFVTKLSPSGSAFLYLTYFGGSDHDEGRAIAVGADGSAYVAGSTYSSDFPKSAISQVGGISSTDAFVTKITASGQALAYSNCFGGGSNESSAGIAVGDDGSAYVTGYTNSTDFPRASPVQVTYGGEGDAYLVKLSPSGSSIVYATYLGGSRGESGSSIAVGADGSAYVVGYTYSVNFPTSTPFQGSRAGEADAFVARLSPSGTSFAYSTYLGGSGYDFGHGIAVGADGNAYVTGYTTSTNFPTAFPAQGGLSGSSDIFVTKLAPSGLGLIYSTYVGGTHNDSGRGIAVGPDGSASVTGSTYSTDFPTTAPVQAALAGPGDAFVLKLTPSGSAFSFSTYLGGPEEDWGVGIALGADGTAYVAGDSGNEDNISNAFVVKITTGTATTPGVYVSSSGAWFLRNANASGVADLVFAYGAGGQAVPIAGDWNGDGTDTPGLYFPTTGAFFLRNANSAGAADLVFTFGAGGAGFVPLVGDWNDNGVDTVGIYNPATGAFFLRNLNTPGPAHVAFTFGAGGVGYVPLAGDWDNDGDDTVGLYAPVSGAFFLKNVNAGGAANVVFTFGSGGAEFVPLAGDWDGDGRDTVGLYTGVTGAFFLSNTNAPGPADLAFSYGPPGAAPLVGDWDGQ